MGRTYLAETSVQQQIDAIIGQQESCIGLVIGQLQTSASKDFVAHLVGTPVVPTSPSSSVEDVDVLVDTATPTQWLSLDEAEEQYIANHARQVSRMLMGGFDVIGIFACAKPEQMKNAQTKLRQFIFAIHKVLSKMDTVIGSPTMHGDRLQMQICPLTKKITCRTFDVTDHKSTSCPAELKFQKFVDSFLHLQTTFSLDIVVPIPLDSMSQTLNKQILAGLQPLFQDVWNSVATVDGRLMAEGEPLFDRPAEKMKSKQRQEVVEAPVFQVDLLHQLNPVVGPLSGSSVVECGARMIIRGTVTSKAFVHAKSTVPDAIQALKKDVIRSIVARCELLCEDLLQTEEEQDIKVLYETPLRVFTSLPSNPSVNFCDYLFPDEDISDCVCRFRELLSIDIEPDSIDTELEHLPTEADLVKPPKPTRKSRQVRPVATAGSSGSMRQWSKYVGLGVSAAVALAAGFATYWFSNPTKSSQQQQPQH